MASCAGTWASSTHISGPGFTQSTSDTLGIQLNRLWTLTTQEIVVFSDPQQSLFNSSSSHTRAGVWHNDAHTPGSIVLTTDSGSPFLHLVYSLESHGGAEFLGCPTGKFFLVSRNTDSS